MSQAEPPPPSPPEDPWERARLAAREDVARIFAPHERICPSCGHHETGPGRLCSNCGEDLFARRDRRRLRRRTIAAAVLGVVAAGAAIALLTAPWRRDAGELAAGQRAAQARLEAAERRRLIEEAKPHFAKGPPRRAGEDALTHRRVLVRTAESAITRDARARVAAGTFKGPVNGTQCAPYPTTSFRRAAEADPSVARGRYECLAYSSKFALPELEGKARTGLIGTYFWAVLDYRRSTIVWCKVSPRAGEGGRSLAYVPVPPPCRDPNPQAG